MQIIKFSGKGKYEKLTNNTMFDTAASAQSQKKTR